MLDRSGWQDVKYGFGKMKFSLTETELLPTALLCFQWADEHKK
jgi:hypothetical protein